MHSRRLAILPVASIVLGGCGTLPNGHLWGEDATVHPGWERVRASAVSAARDPWVWAPLLGAAIFQVDDWDRRTSDWAREHTPVFGSQQNAENWSDDLRTASALAHYVTVVATPGGEEPTAWLAAKTKGVLVDMTAVGATSFVTRELKAATDRERPNGASEESFPSGHVSTSAVHTRLASENLQAIDMSSSLRGLADASLTAMTIGTAWARVEAGWHFPSDTLFSMALGNFTASFVNDTFLGLQDSNRTVALVPTPRGAMLQWSWQF
jgi:hypothetical protein